MTESPLFSPQQKPVLGLLGHINSPKSNLSTAQGVGIDYNAELIKTAGINSNTQGAKAEWLIYNFNDDQDDVASTLIDTHQITHMFIYLVPKQLAMPTVRGAGKTPGLRCCCLTDCGN
ncbi:hypothetical protein ONS95_005292 [Cadophora gregata]|uniref:uncharacterized protein n=1 Tax=Cadophora gregata TaxID=51156 RepID=UPI0026DCFE79|nr:uncharacterized protein ONS95_005292 [Cadophora gregata]KAK0103258.1 hypothetical protein ONS95_005292 [Cadophora gregata]